MHHLLFMFKGGSSSAITIYPIDTKICDVARPIFDILWGKESCWGHKWTPSINLGYLEILLNLLMYKKMQLDVEVSPPANRMGLRLTSTHVAFDLSDL